MKNFTTRSLRRPLALATLPMIAMAAQAQTQPNIVFFLVDDMGWQETTVPFWTEQTALNKRYRTPNMERLAERGVKFTSAYGCPVSTPSRSSLLSGMNAARHQVTNWIEGGNQNTNASGGTIDLPAWNWNGVQPAGNATAEKLSNCQLITPLPQILHDNGYYTIHSGKANWGASGTPGDNPLVFGFDVNIGGSYHGGPGSYLASDNYTSGYKNVAGLEEYAKQGYFLTEAITLETIKQLDLRPKDKPFYLYLSHYAIHTPYDADSRYTANYMENGKGVYDEFLGTNLNTNEINHAALIEGMDKSLGDVLDYLEANNLTDNTIILFMSDNGGQAVSVRQGRMNIDQNYPSRGGKGSCYDGGVHEPMIVSWPGVSPQGTSCSSNVMAEDFFPSILEMAGVTNPTTVQTVDGQSFCDMVKDPTIDRARISLWHYPNRWGESADKTYGYGTWSAMMKGDYHILYFWENQELRLYNIKEDISEANNLAESEPEILRDMAQTLTDELQRMGAARPSKNGTPVIWPIEALDKADAADVPETVQSGHTYTIQPFLAQEKYLTAVSPDAWGTSDGKKKVQYTTEPTAENGSQWIISGDESGYNISPADESFTKLYLNPRGSDNPGWVGTWSAGTGNDLWLIDPVEGFLDVYTINGNKHTNDYMYYNADDEYLMYMPGSDVTPTDVNYFVMKDIKSPERGIYTIKLANVSEDLYLSTTMVADNSQQTFSIQSEPTPFVFRGTADGTFTIMSGNDAQYVGTDVTNSWDVSNDKSEWMVKPVETTEGSLLNAGKVYIYKSSTKGLGVDNQAAGKGVFTDKTGQAWILERWDEPVKHTGASEVTPDPVDYSDVMPALTTKLTDPVYYFMKNISQLVYADYAQGFSSYMYTVDAPTETSLFFFVGSETSNGLTVKIHNAADPTLCLNGRNSWYTDDTAYDWTITGATMGDYKGVVIERSPDEEKSRALYCASGGTYVDYGAPTSFGSLWSLEKATSVGLNTVLRNDASNVTFDLQGRKASNNQHGVYISNGKKVIK